MVRLQGSVKRRRLKKTPFGSETGQPARRLRLALRNAFLGRAHGRPRYQAETLAPVPAHQQQHRRNAETDG